MTAVSCNEMIGVGYHGQSEGMRLLLGGGNQSQINVKSRELTGRKVNGMLQSVWETVICLYVSKCTCMSHLVILYS